MGYDGTLKFDTKVDESGFEKGVGKIGSLASGAIKTTTAIIGGASTAIVGLGTAAVKVGSDFEASMSNVAAISGATGGDLDKLTAKAQEMGAKTKFSASESADAFSYMAMAGWKTEDMLGGIEGIMNLAAASGEDLATTSDIVTDALTAFGLSAQDSGHFADILAAASSNANTNVGLMGETFKYVAPVAGSLGFSAEDCATAIGLMANAGIKGSQAGTALRSTFTRLAKPTKETQTAMDALGISLTDEQGNVKDLNTLMGEMRTSFAKCTDAEKAQYASMIAGQEGMSGLLAIVNASEEDYNKLTTAIANSTDETTGFSAAQQMAEKQVDNLQGQLTILKSGLEGFGIKIYQSVDNPLKDVVKTAQGMVQQLTEAFDKGGFDGLVSAIGDVLSQVVTKIAQAAPKVINMAVSLVHSFCEGLKNADGLAESAAELVTALANGILSCAGDLWTTAVTLITQLVLALEDHLPEILQTGIDVILNIIDGIAEALPKLLPAAVRIIGELAKKLVANLPKIVDAAISLIMAFIDGLMEALPELIDAAIEVFSALIDAIPVVIDKILAILPELIKKVVDLLIKNIPKIIDGGVKLFMGLCKAIPKVIKSLVKALPDIIKAIVAALPDLIKSLIEGILGCLPDLIQGVVDLVLGLVEALPDIIMALIEALPTIITSIVEALIECLPQLIQGLIQLVIALVTHLPEIIMALIEAIPQIIEAIVKGLIECAPQLWEGITSIFSGAWEAAKAAWEGVTDFFAGIWEGIQNAFSGVVDWFKDIFSKAWEGITNIWNAVIDWFQGIWDGICNVFKGVGDWFKKIFSGAWEGIKNAWSSVKNFFKGIWDGICGVFKGVGDWFKGIFEKAVSGIKNAWNGIKEWFSNLWQGIWNVIKTPINWIIGAVNTIIDGLNMISIDIPDWVPIIGGQHWGFDLSHIDYLANGGVVNKPTPAIVGENGPEAVIPLKRNTEWINGVSKSVAEQVAREMRTTVKVETGKISYEKTGRQEYERAVEERRSKAEVTVTGTLEGDRTLELHSEMYLDSEKVAEKVTPAVNHEMYKIDSRENNRGRGN